MIILLGMHQAIEIVSLSFNVEGYSCDVTHGLDFPTIASAIKIKSKISICYFAD